MPFSDHFPVIWWGFHPQMRFSQTLVNNQRRMDLDVYPLWKVFAHDAGEALGDLWVGLSDATRFTIMGRGSPILDELKSAVAMVPQRIPRLFLRQANIVLETGVEQGRFFVRAATYLIHYVLSVAPRGGAARIDGCCLTAFSRDMFK